MKPLTVKGGVDFAVSVEAETLKSISVLKGSNDIESVVFLPKYVNAPVRKGQRVGEVCFYVDDVLVYKSDLVASSNVQEMSFRLAMLKLLNDLLK
jgi:D-alanyl-D-alanine carboxypeptidase (penicillin-binding protein 5/6)